MVVPILLVTSIGMALSKVNCDLQGSGIKKKVPAAESPGNLYLTTQEKVEKKHTWMSQDVRING